MKSSSDGTLVPVATGLRLRGAGGRLTARLVRDGVDQFEGRAWVAVGRAGGASRRFDVEEHTVYAGKVVLKLRGIDDAAGAEALAGLDILIPCNGLVDLPEGSYYIFELIGLRVETRDGRALGVVRDIVQTGGTPLLAIEKQDGAGPSADPILLPAARAIATIDAAAGRIVVDPPEGLLDLYGL